MTTLMYHDRKMMVVLTRKCECFIIELDVLGTWGRENYGKPLFLSIQYSTMTDACTLFRKLENATSIVPLLGEKIMN